jgi:CDP-diacylglycerol--serine O-phosphatidyltransferase
MRRGAPTLRRRPPRGTVRHRGRRPLPPVSVVPTIITLGNLVAGFAAIHYASKPLDASGPWGWTSLTVAGALIFAGMFCDAVDGSVARLTRSTSDLGAQLDSLADLVTFGVAPAFMMLRLVSHMLAGGGAGGAIVGPETDSELAKVLWAVAAAYVVATALRLARFNVETPSAAVSDHMVFRGLPSPGAAGAIASLILLHQHLLGGPEALDGDPGPLSKAFAFAIPFVTLACAAGMVSSLPYVHVMNRYVAGGRSFAYVVRIVLPLFPLMLWFQETMAVGFTAYALSAPLRRLRPRWRRGAGRSAPASPASETASTPPDGPDTLRP